MDPNQTMRDLLALYPGAQRALFRKYHIGPFSPKIPLAAVFVPCESPRSFS